MPFWFQCNDSGVQISCNSAAHTYNQAFSQKYFLPVPEMLYDIPGNVFDSVFTAHQCFQLRPFGFGFLRVGQIFQFQFVIQFLH